jgi:hypothetical protein
MTQSTELTGGAGFTFEGNVAATYLVSLLIEGPARGLSGGTVARVAVQQAEFGEPDLFQNRKPPGTDNNILLGAVAGTAAAALSFGGTLNDVDLTWAKAVIERASETPEIDDGLWFARSNDPHHPCNYAVRGFAALIRRGIDVGVAKRRLLELASHPLDQVSEEAIGAALGLWQDDANFAFVALDLGLKFSTGLRHTIRSAYGYEPSGDRERRASAVGEALRWEQLNFWTAAPNQCFATRRLRQLHIETVIFMAIICLI